MKHRFLIILQVTIIIVLTALMSTSGAAEAASMNFKSSGSYALVDFFNDSNIQATSGFVQISEEMFKNAPGSPVRPGPMGFLTISINNWCDNDDDYNYGYEYKWGTATIELTSFEVSGNLGRASAEGKGVLIWEDPYLYPYSNNPYSPTPIPPMPPYPYPPPPPPEEVTIKITWTSENETSSGHNNIRTSIGNMRMHMHSSGTFRYATATGLIKGETFEVEVKPPPPPEPYPLPVPIDPYPYPAPYPYFYATIGRSRAGYISIYKHKP